jgi:uncharacterized protein (DUF362 family)
MRECGILSLAKVRILEEPIVVFLAVKNFFGMIPGPDRGKYHGKGHSRLDRSIVDIYKLYDSLFNIHAVVEAALTASLRDSGTMEWETLRDPGFVSASHDPLALDAYVTSLLGIDPHDVGYLELAAETFGGWDSEVFEPGLRSGITIL